MRVHNTTPASRSRASAHRALLAVAAVAAILGASARTGRAVNIPFSLVPASSNIAAAFDLSALGGAVTAAAQKPGSLTSRYSGTLETNVFLASIAFPGGSTADATQYPSGLSPAVGGNPGSAPADYGVRFTAPVGQPIPPIDIPNVGTINLGTLDSFVTDIALRNIKLDVTNLGTIGLVAGAFDASQTTILPTGTADINVAIRIASPDVVTHLINLTLLQTLATQSPFPISVTGSGNFITGFKINVSTGFSQLLDGLSLPNSATGGMLATVGPNFELTLPVDVHAVPDLGDIGMLLGLDVHLTGQLFGRAPVVEIPEPSTWLLSLAAALGLFVTRKARKS